ncbi:MAG: hypothetical protein AB7S75_04220 [Desulfococcaceae bacterium]
MPYSIALLRKLDFVNPELKSLLWDILEEIEQNREASVTKTEFNELKEIAGELGRTVKELAVVQIRTEKRLEELTQAQNRTEKRFEELAQRVNELAQAQSRTEKRVEELAEAQNRTEKRVEELAEAQNRTEKRVEELAEAQNRTEKEVAKLTGAVVQLRHQVGGLSKSVAYALENEAFRKLPDYLKSNHHIHIKEKFVRKFIGGEEINIFGMAERNGGEILIVGESVLKLDDRSKLAQLEKNVQAVKQFFPQQIFPLIITHFAHPEVLEKAKEQGILVVQSFEWD